MRFQFDESSGSFKPEKPYSQQIHTDVQLLSVTPAH